MPGVPFSEALRREYEALFNTCVVRPEKAASVESIIARLHANRSRYESVAGEPGIPWHFIAVIHNMEASLDFNCHLHNGDPLTARTVQVPVGRPKAGSPPFTWEQSAADALNWKGLSATTDWSLAGTLYQIEKYNGWGYRLGHPGVLSPYLWGFSTHYKQGKFIADHKWSDTAVSRQCGAAVLLRRMAENGQIEFVDQPAPKPADPPAIVGYSATKSSDPTVAARAKDLQRWLNTFPGIFVKEDGVPGLRTSDAYRMVTGNYLPGDPRA